MFYVLVVENDAGIYRVDSKEGRPIVFEQYLDQGAATLENVSKQKQLLRDKYGKTKIARLQFIEPLQCGDCGQYYDPATSPFTGVCPKCFKESKHEYDGVAELPEAVF